MDDRESASVPAPLGATHVTMTVARGKACENEQFGLGAAAYYRRVVEDFVRNKLDEKESQLARQAQADFKAAADQLRREWSGNAAIELIKDDLPAETRPGGHNPLSVLYSDLSRALHTESEEACAETAGTSRPLLEGFFLQLERARESAAFAKRVAGAAGRSGKTRD